MNISIIIPLYNEEENVEELYRNIIAIEKDVELLEIIWVDDCSDDGTFDKISSLAKNDKRVKVIRFRKNSGQTAAISAGIDSASGEAIITMDGDNQNDPWDIPKLVKKLEEGYDLVSGWRKSRWKGEFFKRKLPSILANKIISAVGGIPIHDFGCSLKAYRASFIKSIKMYGDMHRYLPLYIHWQGGKIAEMEVSCYERTKGTSKYGFERIFKVLYDLTALHYYGRYFNHPMYFFGKISLIFCVLGIVCLIYVFYQRYMVEISGVNLLPLLLLVIFFLLSSLLFLVLGIIAELIMRTYYESQEKSTYSIRETINFE